MRWTTMSTGWPTTTPTRVRLADGLQGWPACRCEPPQTNIVFVDLLLSPHATCAPSGWADSGPMCSTPRVAIFFLAFVPQFIAPDADNKALAFVLLGVLFNLNAIPVNSGWALAAAWMAAARCRPARHALA
jgi:hypothetical protein